MEKSPPSWKTVDRLIDEQKYRAALEEARRLLEAAADETGRTRAVLQVAELEMALGGFEKAVTFLRTQPRPNDPVLRAQIELEYARTLESYLDAYSWEIGRREAVGPTDAVGVDRWTRTQIVGEIGAAYGRVWAVREALGAVPLDRLADVLVPNDYPKGIRDTVRDAVSYLWARFLSDTAYWLPGQQDATWTLDLAALIGGRPLPGGDEALADPHVHPLARIAAILGDLERWHTGRNEPEAALEAFRKRLEILHGAVTAREDRRTIRIALHERLESTDRRLPWWSWARATEADMTASDPAPDALVRARALALDGIEANPGTPGAARCRAIVSRIEAPSYAMIAMRSDAPDRRSIKVTHRNLGRLHFRAWRFDPEAWLERGGRQWRPLLPDARDIEAIRSTRPDARWTVDLAPTPDFRDHVTWVVPPMKKPGLWVVMASVREDFRGENNALAAVDVILGDLVAVARQDEDSASVEVTVRSGATGAPVEGARVRLYRVNRRNGPEAVEERSSDRDGRVVFGLTRDASYTVLASRGHDHALLTGGTLRARRPRRTERSGSLVFTDRAVYRPGQTIHAKVIAYRGDDASGRFHVAAGETVTLTLRDANGRTVTSRNLSTNTFGSADADFPIPAGRLLGAWRVDSSLGGSAPVRVEEYKRPTFTVEITDPSAPLRLNREAALAGEARYYFGLPVSEGTARWRVERVPVWPRWWGWWWRPAPPHPEVIAAGEAKVGEDGRFTVRFTPSADERQARRGVTYRFRLVAEVTDAGGETRTGERTFRLGFAAVEVSIGDGPGFLRPHAPAAFTLRRTDLDGNPAPGDGAWRLVRLEQPEETVLPADLPLAPSPDEPEGAYHTPGDRQRPRWDADPDPERFLRTWAEGATVREGAVAYGEAGTAELALRDLDPGAYRLVVTSRDRFGAEAKATRNLLVVRRGKAPLALPLVLSTERSEAAPGNRLLVLAHSGLPGQTMVLERFRAGRRIERRTLRSGADPAVLELPVTEDDRGGFVVRLTALRDHQLMTLERTVRVPWNDRKLDLELGSFRDRMRPGERETFSITVRGPDGKAVAEGAAELLATMYDASLDLFAPYEPPDPLGLYPGRASAGRLLTGLGSATPAWHGGTGIRPSVHAPSFSGDRIRTLDRYGIGGPGMRGMPRMMFKAGTPRMEAVPSPAMAEDEAVAGEDRQAKARVPNAPEPPPAEAPPVELRSDFAETALWAPHLVTNADGSVTVAFDVPDSVTGWNLWVVATTRDLMAGRLHRTARTVKELMVRPYLPRFLREGDRATIRVRVDDAGEGPLEGTLDLDILDPATGESVAAAFGLEPATRSGVAFSVEPGKGTTLEFPVAVPPRPGLVAFRVTARSGGLSDGELRPLPVLPGRYHLMQSRFAALRDDDHRTLEFPEMADRSDPTRVDEQLVVTVDAQLFTTVLRALPYLVRYPYECTEQTLNRFVSTAIVTSVFDRHPEIAALAKKLAARRDTRLERWDRPDPNRTMLLEETPWIVEAEGGSQDPAELIRILDPEIAAANRRQALAKLAKAQLPDGAFPWWPGGPPSPYMTCLILDGLSRAVEHGAEVPQGMVQRAWRSLHRWWIEKLVPNAIEEDCCWEMVTYLGYVLSCYPDDSWTGGVFTDLDRERMVDFSFSHWKDHSPRLKAYLALTLERMGRHADARLVFDSVMDSAVTDPDLGTYWQPEARSWLWYNDTTEGHALALRTLVELEPDDPRRDGLVQWLLLDKKLDHWKSTRATAEVIWALVAAMERGGDLGAAQTVEVDAGPRSARYVFEPDEPVTRAQLVVPGDAIVPDAMSRIEVTSRGKGFAFATATWHFSTEQEPESGGAGTLLAVDRSFYRRVRKGDEWVLEPLARGDAVGVGDELAVEVRLTARHRMEYVHLRDPRGAGFEPVSLRSGYRWVGGLGVYEEVRDSGENWFIERLPAGEYVLRYRLRAATAGRFRIGPAVVQCLYAPEHGAYSAGMILEVTDR